MCACVQHCNCICRQCRKCRERRKNDNGMNRWDRTPNPSDCTCRSEYTQTIGSNAKHYHRNETTNHATTCSPVLPTTSVLTLSRRHPQSWTGLQARAPSTGTCKLHGATWNTNICPVSVTTKQTSHTCQTIHEPIQTQTTKCHINSRQRKIGRQFRITNDNLARHIKYTLRVQ